MEPTLSGRRPISLSIADAWLAMPAPSKLWWPTNRSRHGAQGGQAIRWMMPTYIVRRWGGELSSSTVRTTRRGPYLESSTRGLSISRIQRSGNTDAGLVRVRTWLVTEGLRVIGPHLNDGDRLVVPPDSYFALGGKPPTLLRQRETGFIPVSHILGSAQPRSISHRSGGGIRWSRRGKALRVSYSDKIPHLMRNTPRPSTARSRLPRSVVAEGDQSRRQRRVPRRLERVVLIVLEPPVIAAHRRCKVVSLQDDPQRANRRLRERAGVGRKRQ
jgi:hypothetical protein